MSSLSFFSRLNIVFAAIAHMTWLQSSLLSLSFSPGWIPAFHCPHSVGPRKHKAEEALDTHFMPILMCPLSQLHLADMPHSLHQQTPSIFLTRAAVKPHYPLWDLGSCVLGPKHRASNHLSLLQFHPVGFMQSFRAVWILWSPNSLIWHWWPLSALCCLYSHLVTETRPMGPGTHVSFRLKWSHYSASFWGRSFNILHVPPVLYLLTQVLGEASCSPDTLCLHILPAVLVKAMR